MSQITRVGTEGESASFNYFFQKKTNKQPHNSNPLHAYLGLEALIIVQIF